MKNQSKKVLLLAGVLLLTLTVWGCGDSRETSAQADAAQVQASEVSVSGKILKLGDMQFNVKADNKVVKEDGTIESKGNGHKLTILYDEDTIFYIKTIRDNGNSYEDADAAAGDMEKDMRVDITGSYEGKKFHAAQVQMMKFE